MLNRTSHIALKAAIFTLVLLSLFAERSEAATFTVSNTLNTGAGSLRQAVADSNTAAGSDTIVFDAVVFSTPQTIALASVIAINPATGDSLTITGPGVNLLTVDGNDGVPGNVQIFSVAAGDAVSITGMTLTNGGASAIANSGFLTLSNMSITNSTGGAGGAISSGGESLIITNVTFSGNTATSGSATGLGGGAIYQSNALATATITGSSFTNNAEVGNSGGGGAIRNRTGTMNIANSTFTNNTTVDNSGGGAVVNSDIMSITDSTFTGNTATPRGGGGAITNGGQLTVTRSVITGNSTVTNGGGIASGGALLQITNSTIANNTATGVGGGLIVNGASSTISGSTISGNQATGAASDGGGLYASGGTTNLTNSTVSGNTAGRNGGGVYASGISTVITNIESSTVVNNTAVTTGGGLVRASTTNPVNLHNSIFANNSATTAPDISGSVISQDFNLIENTSGATVTGATTNNLTGQDPNLGSLSNNGGPTLTHALLPGSPAVDSADPVSFPGTDQRGAGRPVDGDSSGGPRADIGAFELLGTTAADVMIIGRLLASNGRAISAALVRLHNPRGDTVTVKTNAFGYFRFTGVTSGESYLVTVAARGYTFVPLLLAVDDNITDLVLTPTGRR